MAKIDKIYHLIIGVVFIIINGLIGVIYGFKSIELFYTLFSLLIIMPFINLFFTIFKEIKNIPYKVYSSYNVVNSLLIIGGSLGLYLAFKIDISFYWYYLGLLIYLIAVVIVAIIIEHRHKNDVNRPKIIPNN